MCRTVWTLTAIGLGLCALAAYVWWDTLNEAHRAAQRIVEESLLSHEKHRMVDKMPRLGGPMDDGEPEWLDFGTFAYDSGVRRN